MDELYAATIDKPAECNRVPISVSEVDSVASALLFTGADKTVDTGLPPEAFYVKLAQCVQRPRMCGSATLDLCHVACGRGDAYFEAEIHVWDVAAGGLIVRQAGGNAGPLGTWDDGRLVYLATNGRIHEEFTGIVQPLIDRIEALRPV
jgi:myo-inositol-1(or 4)-monophosphatase